MNRDHQALPSFTPFVFYSGQEELKEPAVAGLPFGVDIPSTLKPAFPFSDSLMYSQILSHTWTNYMFVISGQHDFSKGQSADSQECGIPQTVKLADILPSNIPGNELPGLSIKSAPKSQIANNNSCTCQHCGTDKTSLWRRRGGLIVCNACALYEKLHGIPRPAHLLNQALRRRNRSDSSRKTRAM